MIVPLAALDLDGGLDVTWPSPRPRVPADQLAHPDAIGDDLVDGRVRRQLAKLDLTSHRRPGTCSRRPGYHDTILLRHVDR